MSKQVLTRQRVLELIDQLQVGQAIPSERRLSSDLGIRRLRLADGEPMALETLHVPAALVPGLTRERLENSSFYDLLEREYGVVISNGTQSIEPTVTNEEESELLNVPLHSPAFLFERTSRAEDGETGRPPCNPHSSARNEARGRLVLRRPHPPPRPSRSRRHRRARLHGSAA